MNAFLPGRVRYRGLLAPHDALARQNSRVRDLEHLLLQQPQVDLQTKTLTHGGVNVRWIFVPRDGKLTGAITKKDNVCIVFGDIEVTTEEGPRRFTGFNVLPACAGSKRAGHALADTWWATAWRTDLTDPNEIEDEMTDEAAQLQTRRAGIEWAARPELEG